MTQAINIRLYTYKSFRHYGGREISTTPHICKAAVLSENRDNTILVELLEDCAGFKSGHKISIQPKDFNL